MGVAVYRPDTGGGNMRSFRSAVALALCLALSACGKDEEEQKPTPCQTYCGEVAVSCTPASGFAQYPAHGLITCAAYCDQAAAFAVGAVGATTGNTVECRRTYARRAASDAAANCVPAGPSGGGVCGGLCENYCALALKNCTGANALYASMTSCLTACGGFPANGPWDEMSDSVQCRLMEAAESFVKPEEHCPHAAAVSSVCK